MRQGDMTLGALIEIVRVRTDRSVPFEVYSTWEGYDDFTVATRVHVAAPPADDRDDDDVPAAIAALGLWVFCSGELLEDVVDNRGCAEARCLL